MIQRTDFTEWSGSTEDVTISHTCSSYYRGLIVGVKGGGSTTYDPTVTYGGVAMTKLYRQPLNITSVFAIYYYLQNPARGVNNLVVNAASGESTENIFASSYKNTSQSALINTSVSGSDGGGAGTWNLTTTVDDTWAVSMVADAFGGSSQLFSNGTNLTFLSSNITQRLGDSNASLGTAGSKTVGASSDGASTWYYLSAAIAPAVTIPLTSTTAVSNIALTSARAASEVLYDGDATVTARGFVYSLTTVPTLANNVATTTGTVGTYSVDLTGLAVNTTYYIRSYATTATGTGYGTETSFTTLNIGQYELQKDIGAIEGQTFVGQINVTGSAGTVTVKLGTTGSSTVINAGAGNASFSGTYSGTSGLIITRSASFNGTIDNVYYVAAPIGTTVNWSLDSLTIVSAIDSSVFFKRIEDDVFNSFCFYRYLDLLFKDLDGYVTVTVRDEREDITTERQKTFSVGNIGSGTVSPFQKKRVSFLIKNQAVIIGLSNGNISETFSIAQFLLTGHKKPQKNFSPSKIQSLS